MLYKERRSKRIMSPKLYKSDNTYSAIRKSLKCKIQRAVTKLWKDIYRCRIAILIIIIYWISAQIVFGTMCPFKILTGQDCPGCGLTRGCLCVLTGHFNQAISYNPMSFAWVVLIIWLLWERYLTDKKNIFWELPVILVSSATIIVWILPIAHLL